MNKAVNGGIEEWSSFLLKLLVETLGETAAGTNFQTWTTTPDVCILSRQFCKKKKVCPPPRRLGKVTWQAV